MRKRTNQISKRVDQKPKKQPVNINMQEILDPWKYSPIYPKNVNQKEYMYSILNNIITIVSGPPGVAKTLLALYLGFELLSKGKIEKIIYIKPDVGMIGQRSKGFLPGKNLDKMWYLIGPVLDNLSVFMPRNTAIYHLQKETIEILALEDLRGRSLNNCLALFDECQNLTISDIKTILTRTGYNAHMVLAGDPKQCDTKNLDNGLEDAVKRLKQLKNVGIITFTSADIVRNSIIPDILERYE